MLCPIMPDVVGRSCRSVSFAITMGRYTNDFLRSEDASCPSLIALWTLNTLVPLLTWDDSRCRTEPGLSNVYLSGLLLRPPL